jgi:hypothetical protein
LEFGSNTLCTSVSRYLFIFDPARIILAAHRIVARIISWCGIGPNRIEDIDFPVPDFICLIGYRRLHGDHAKKLHQVILDHIPQRPGFVVVLTPVLHIHRFSYRYLHIFDVIAVPERFKNGVGKPECQDILHGFFSQVMVDPVDLVFLKTFGQLLV